MYALDTNTVVVTVKYQEPTQRSDNTLITNLHHCNVFYQINAGAGIQEPNIAATTTNGGGIVTTMFNLPIPQGQAATVNWWVIATDAAGFASASSNQRIVFIDRRFFSTPVSMPHLGYRPGYV